MTGDDLLFDACRKGQLRAVNGLIDRILVFRLKPKANVNARDREGFTPLYYAVRDGHKRIVKVLLDKGADASVRDRSGATLLHHAVRGGHREIVRLLIAAGANVNARDKSSATPIQHAMAADHKDIVRLLIAKGASLDEKVKAGFVSSSRATPAGRVGKAAAKVVEPKPKSRAGAAPDTPPVRSRKEPPGAVPLPPSEATARERKRPSGLRAAAGDASAMPLDSRLSEIADVNDFIFDERDRLLAGKRRRDDSTEIVWDLLHDYNLFRGMVACDHIDKSRAILMYATGARGGLPNMVGEICRTVDGAVLVMGGDLRHKTGKWFDLVELLSRRHKELGITEASFYDMTGEISIIIEKSPEKRLSNIERALGRRSA